MFYCDFFSRLNFIWLVFQSCWSSFSPEWTLSAHVPARPSNRQELRARQSENNIVCMAYQKEKKHLDLTDTCQSTNPPWLLLLWWLQCYVIRGYVGRTWYSIPWLATDSQPVTTSWYGTSIPELTSNYQWGRPVLGYFLHAAAVADFCVSLVGSLYLSEDRQFMPSKCIGHL